MSPLCCRQSRGLVPTGPMEEGLWLTRTTASLVLLDLLIIRWERTEV